MKILIVVTRGDSVGGAQTHVLTLARMLQKHEHEVLVCYGGKTEGPFNDLLIAAGINCVTVPCLIREISPIADFKSVFKLRRIYKSFGPDVVSLHSSKAGIIGRLSGMFSKIPIVFTVHGWAFTEGVGSAKAAFYKFLEKSLSGLAARIIVVSHYDKQIAVENKVANAAKIQVVHNGIAVSANERKVIEGKKITDIVMVARFDEQKDHETLIRACIDIDHIKVHFLGDGPGLNAAIVLTSDLKIRDKFEFYGYTNKVEKILETSDIFALISNWEGFPISTLEAMNYSLPVVVSDVGGAKEAVIDGETGYIIKRKDVENLKIKLLGLINSPSLAKSMGLNGKNLLVNEFSCEAMYENIMRVFNSVLYQDSSRLS